MKKFCIYFVAFIFICFILPALFTTRSKEKETMATIEENQNTEESSNQVLNENQNETTNKIAEVTYNYTQYGTIKLLHTQTQQIEEIKLDEYLYGVVSAEMPANYEKEALKAQAVVARTYTIYQIMNSKGKHEEADICDSYTCCQAWISKEDRFARWEESQRETNWNKIVSAVNETAGQIITYDGAPIDAFFHSNSGGITETATNVWGGTNYPYLQSVETAGEEGYSQYSSEVILSKDELISKLKENYPKIQINFEDPNSIQITEYTESKRVKTVKFGNTDIPGTKVRSILGLKSTNFEIKKEGEKFTFSVIGYGHGVGMSQTGADTLAKQGKNFEEIIMHFYTGVVISAM